MAFDYGVIQRVYQSIGERVAAARALVGRPLTLAEKVLYAHACAMATRAHARGESYVEFNPDRVAMQDATAQMALLQFMQSGRSRVAVPTTVHADHLIPAKDGAAKDLPAALDMNREVYGFLSSVSQKYGIGFWKPGAGIIHQVVLENYAFPGGMVIGTDSHTPNAGGLAMVAVGVGGADAVDVMAGMPWELRFPKILGVRLTGALGGWTSPKDVILKLAGMLTVKGGTGYVIEYFGEGAQSISCTGKGTICNMGAEVGATTSIFPFDDTMYEYLIATHRTCVAKAARDVSEHLRADDAVYAEPEAFFDQVVEIDLSSLEPHINGPFTPDAACPISEFASVVKEKGYPQKLDVGLIGSCTNSSYEDLDRAASLARQAVTKGLDAKAELLISPGSEQVRYTVKRDGQLADLEAIGGVVLTNACGPCIGQWKRAGAEKGEPNSIVHSFNRNFAKRADGNPNTHAFVASPEIVTAMAIAGDLTFNPLTDTLVNKAGEAVKLDPPSGVELPPNGFAVDEPGYQSPAEDGDHIQVVVAPDSERLQLLEPFAAWEGVDLTGLRLLLKAKGKCTTDHISMAGPWLRFRGHLDNISNNCFIGAVNAFNDKTNSVKNQLSDAYGPVPETQRAYKAAGIGTIVVGDENYGEGSSREHAAMEPRHLGVRAILVRSFARIHETNLKKQGMLALTFANAADYDKVQEDDIVDILGLTAFTPGVPLTIVLHHADGSTDTLKADHSYNEAQIAWFKAGGALNLIRAQLDA
ncbi:MAG TPA: aconitate hydratase [Candidatus Hydrogenedentes bacterium]|mgnify:CR=1 FL=1|nr:aconitate hydratase [Candidatus Hydrogenedentota bacterium]HPG67709.1 aconitate hydratase [Candidatus Hydrogenedentota bacterium]